jgi:hypothetical protein
VNYGAILTECWSLTIVHSSHFVIVRGLRSMSSYLWSTDLRESLLSNGSWSSLKPCSCLDVDPSRWAFSSHPIVHSARHKSMSTSITPHLTKFYHLSLIAAPSFSVKILHRRDISLIRLLISSIVSLSQSFNMTCFSSANVLHCRLLTRCFGWKFWWGEK